MNGRLHEAVVDFRYEAFDLGEELSRLERIRSRGAPEAEILYTSRVLESLAAAALSLAGLPASSNAFSNLTTLADYNLLPRAINYWAHALRRLGNDVRHVARSVSDAEGELAILLGERWIRWYFCDFRLGPRLPSLTLDRLPIWKPSRPGVAALIEQLDTEEEITALEEGVDQLYKEELAHFPSLPAVVAEMLMDRQRHDEAMAVLSVGLRSFPEDPRLRQLKGLLLSRMGQIDAALAWLEPLIDRYRQDDEFTGILAGVYRRQWLSTRQRHWLQSAQKAYREGWRRAHRTNAYLGINAATTSLWLDHAPEARRQAREVEALIMGRIESLRQHANGGGILDYWDRVTLAEARLLQGQFAAAWATYHRAFTDYPDQHGNISVSLTQADEILSAWEADGGAERFRETPPPLQVEAFVVGCIGRTGVGDRQGLCTTLGQVWEQVHSLAQQGGRDGLRLQTTLTGVAERLVAHSAKMARVELDVMLPVERSDMIADAPDADEPFVRELLGGAASVTIVGDLVESDASIRAAGQETLDELCIRLITDACDLLIVVWDGPSTSDEDPVRDIVDAARASGQRLVCIDAHHVQDI